MSDSKSEVTLDWVDGYAFRGTDKSGTSLVFDPPGNQAARGVEPMSVLLLSIGACSGMDVVAVLGKRKQKLTSLRIHVDGQRPQHGLPKPYSSISLRFVLTGVGLKKEYVDEAVRGSIEKYCSVVATLKVSPKIGYSFEILED